ncbi:MAG: iron chelate uptake ABC transporter family permease subunit [Buchananella hordeovulneris]|nr:iron chelate uptake ABC transporter family permease subunit [Buchananella hordeovulneris]
MSVRRGGKWLARRGRWSLRGSRRVVWTGAVLAVLIVCLSLLGLLVGEYGLSVAQSWARLWGNPGESGDFLGVYFVQEVRLPRVLGAVTVGACLGLAGALFQSVSGNPLGSPDIVGFSTGAATGAILTIMFVGAAPMVVAGGAVGGGVLVGAVIVLLAGSRLSGLRVILVGIGISAALRAVNSLLLVRASLEAAQAAAQWNAGSLHDVSLPWVAILAVVLLAAAPALWAITGPLAVLSLGDDAAAALGIKAVRTRLAAIALGTLLVSLATAVAGPVAFVALAAPHIARRLHGQVGPSLASAAAVGAALVLVSDLLGQWLLHPAKLAVGVVTGTLGGLYLLLLLFQEHRRNRL